MSRSFNLTAELNLRGPSNIRPIIADIRRQLSGITANVNVTVNNNTARNIGNLQQSVTRLNTALTATRQAATTATAALNAFGRAAANVNNNVGNIPRNLNRINTGANNTANALNQLNRSAGQAATGFEEFGRQSALAVRRFAAFATVTGVIYKFTNALSSATTDFIDFNRELVRVAQVTDSSLSELRPLVAQITNLSTSLGIASKDLIQVSSTLAQAGLSARDTEKALKALALSALAPSFDSLSDTVEGSIALMRQFGISAGDLEDALGSVNAVAAKFAVEASDLITAIQRTGGVFATASKGVSEGKDALNEFLAVFTSVRATTRESAETIATGLRTIFTRIQRSDTIDALKQFGVTLTDLEGKFVGPFEAVRRLSEGLSKLDPRDLRFSQIVEELGGFRQIGKVIPLIQQFATAQAALKVAQQGQGSLAKDASTAQQSLANQISKVREEFTALIRSLGESSTFQTFVRLSLDLASALIRLADSAKTVLPALTAIAAFRGVSALTRFGAGFAGGLRRQNNGGPVRGFATGGLVPGEGNSDTVPAMLTAGEFVIRKKAVQRIGVSNLHKMNRYAGGGFASAPMVDDIKANAKGAMLPNRIALEKILSSGYGALDFDRTLKRTVGDKAYGKAKTSGQKDAVLSKYFKDPQARLNDAKSSKLTQFGRMLQQSIKEGRVNPSNLSIISKSSRTPGLAEYINELFGIPIGNMIFTGGGSKQGAYDALRTKGPRSSRAQRFAGGGEVKPFAVAALFGEGYSPKPIRTPQSKQKVTLQSGIMPEAESVKYQDIMIEGFKQTILKVGSQLAQSVGASVDSSEPKLNAIIKNTGIGNIIGSALEGSLGMAGAPFVEKTKENQSIDFPAGLGPIASKFGLPPGIPTDATRTAGGKGKTFNDFLGQVDRFILKTQGASTEQTQAPSAVTTAIVSKFEKGKTYTLSDLKMSAKDAQAAGFVSPFRGKWQLKAKGGDISGQDTVPALLTPGEFVINKRAAGRIGASRLHQLNRADRVQGFNKGGAVGGIQKLAGGGFLDPQLDNEARKIALELKKGGMDLASALEEARKRVREGMQGPAPASGSSQKTTTNFLPTANGLSDSQRRVQVTRSTEDIQRARLERKAARRNLTDVSFSYDTEGKVKPLSRGGGANISRTSDMLPNAAALNAPVNPSNRTVSGGTVGKLLNQQSQSSLLNFSQGRSASAASYANLAQSSSQKTYAASSFDPTQLYQALGGLNKGLATAANSLTSLSAASKTAGSGIMSLGKGALGAVGRGAGGLVSKIGGGVLGAVGLGGLSSKGKAAAGAGGGGDGVGMMGMALTMAGGVGIDMLSKSAGGEKTEAGRNIASIGGGILNMGSTGAMLGSMFGPMGTAIGAVTGGLIGLGMGLADAERANEEYAQSQREAAAATASDKSGKALEAYMTKPGAAQKQAFMSAMSATSEAEAAVGAGVKRQTASSFGKMLGYQDESITDLAARKAKTQTVGADQAQQFLANEMMRTGKTFGEVSKTMSPDQFKMLTSNIAEADETYAYFQIQRANEIKKLRDSGRGAEADALQAETNTEQANLAKNIAERKLAEASAAAQAKAAADASKKLDMVLMQAVLGLEKAFGSMEEVLNRSSFELGQIADKGDQIFSGKASLTSSTFARTNNVLQNPNAYSAAERQNAINTSAARMGPAGALVGRVATFGAQATEEASRRANAVFNAGGTNEEVGGEVTRSLTNNILATFGPNSSMSQTLIDGVKRSVDEAVKKAKDDGEVLDPNELIEKATGPLNKAAQQAGQLLIKNNENVAKHLEELGKVAERVVEIENRRADRTAALVEMQAQGGISTKEALGQKVSLDERINARFAGSRARLGIQNQSGFTPQNIANMRSQAQKEQAALQSQIDRRSQDVGSDPTGRAAKEVANLQLKLAKVNSTIDQTNKELENLPGALEGAISDVTSEIQNRVAKLDAQKQASGAFAEKLVGSTPQELMELSRTFGLLNNTLRGQVTTIQQSQVAQQAYIQSIQEGKTAQEAMTDAQTAFANENKKALSLFGELTQIAGIDGPELDLMKADLLENFARAQGAGLENNPFFQTLLKKLRESPEDRAQNDPVLKALQARMTELREQQVEAVRLQNEADRDIQKRLLEGVGKNIIDSLAATQTAFVRAMEDIARRMGAAPPRAMPAPGSSTGGLIYASNGQYVNFKPKGTDTVPAMLTPGEFVVNAKATKDNLGLLTAINNSRGGRINYLADGGMTDISGVSSRTQLAKQEDMTRSGLINQRSLSNKIDTVKSLSNNINSTTSFTKDNQIPSLDSTVNDNQTFNTKQFGSLLTKVDKVSQIIEEAMLSRGFSRGGVVYAADGKYINFQPKGTDTVPAMLSPGEFVVNAKATKDNLETLQAINSGYYAAGGQAGVDPSPVNFMKGIVNTRIARAYRDNQDDPTGTNARRQILDERRYSRQQKVAVELYDQINESPKLFGEDAFNLNRFAKLRSVSEQLERGMNAQELFRKATKRQNYLQQVINNTTLGANVVGNIQFPEDLDLRRKPLPIAEYRNLSPLEILNKQNKHATEEVNIIASVWDNVSRGIRMDRNGNITNDNEKIRGLVRDQTTTFNVLNPDSLPGPEYFNRGGVVYAQDGNYIPFRSARDKMLAERRSSYDKEMERRKQQYTTDKQSRMVLSAWEPIWKREAAEQAREDRKKVTPQESFVPFRSGADKEAAAKRAAYDAEKAARKQPQTTPSFVPFRSAADKEASEKRAAYDAEMQRRRTAYTADKQNRQTQAKTAKDSRMVLGAWNPIWAREEAQKKKDDARKAYEKDKVDKAKSYAAGKISRMPQQKAMGGIIYAASGMSIPKDLNSSDPLDNLLRKANETKLANFGNTYESLLVKKYGKFIKPFDNTDVLENLRQYQEFDYLSDEELQSLERRHIKSKLNKKYKLNKFNLGGMVYADKGTLVPYQPKGTDTVPAMLTPGEFVVNRQATQRHLGVLQSINNGNYAKGGPVYLAKGTEGVDVFDSNMTYLSDILKRGADSLNTAFIEAVRKLNNIADNSPQIGQGTPNGVSNTQSNPLANIEALGNRLDQFIEQLKNAVPSTVTLEVPSAIPVNVTINGASILKDVLGGPLGNIVQKAIKDAFDAKSRQNEGY